MTRADVNEIILTPMRACFMPGTHLRGRPDLQDRAIDEYTHALENYSRTTLERAWTHVRDEHELVVWPAVSQFVRAAKTFDTRPTQQAQADQRLERAVNMTDDKLNDYRRSSTLYRQAVREGWDRDLIAFVEAQVWIQAQLLTGCTAVGFDPRLLGKDTPGQSCDQAMAEIRTWMGDRFRDEGKPRVKPPPVNLVHKWKANATALLLPPVAENAERSR